VLLCGKSICIVRQSSRYVASMVVEAAGFQSFCQTRSQDCKFFFGGGTSMFGGQTYFEYYYTATVC